MATITVTPTQTFISGDTVLAATLNQLAQSTVALTAGTIVAADIASDAVTTVKILDAAVTNAKIASGVDASKLTTGTLPADRIGSSAITTARINDSAVIPAKLSQPYTLATAQNSTSGTSIDFTGIPSWAKRIAVILNGVSTNGTSSYLIRIGDSGGIESTGYTSTAYGQTNVVNTSTSGFIINCTGVFASDARHGLITIATLGSNIWVASGNVSPANGQLAACSGIKTLSDTLTQVSITTVNGDTFDAGSINISYEG